jgi:diaminohydroxyphosphoribosylaminopyrimidine deaminase/5-amino-6-(5-phosphoribosylamino)uracil reductase
LIEAGVSRVVYGSVDPNPKHAGAADKFFSAAGIEVLGGVLKEECDAILRPFSKVQRTGLPWVIWKCAMSLDGKITRPDGEGQWLSGVESRADVQRLRSEVDAILTSGETVRRDKPALTIRVPELLDGRDQPWRIVVSDHPDTMPTDAAIFSDQWSHKTLMRSRGNLEKMLEAFVSEQGVLSVLIEAGGKFSAAMIAARLVDEVVLYYVPMLCGGTVSALSGVDFPESFRLEEMTYETLSKDLRVRGLLVK